MTGRRLEKIAGCVASVRCLQKEKKWERGEKGIHEWRRFVAPRHDDDGHAAIDSTAVRRFVNL